MICNEAEIFIGTQGSTVSNYINFINYKRGKEYRLHCHMSNNSFNPKTLMLNKTSNKHYTWREYGYSGGHTIGWSLFFPDNITKFN